MICVSKDYLVERLVDIQEHLVADIVAEVVDMGSDTL